VKVRAPHPTQWTAVVCGGALLPGEHAILRKSKGEAEDVIDLYRRDATAKGEAFVSLLIPPKGGTR
jgi:hypothetical protein